MGTGTLVRLLDRTADAAFASNREGIICVWNCSAEKLFGYGVEEALKMPCSELLSCQPSSHSQTCSKQCGVIAHCLFGRTVPNFDMKVKVSSGTWIWINVSILVFDQQSNNDLLVVHLARDITHRKEIEQLNQQLVLLAKKIAQSPEQDNSSAPIVPLTDQEQKILRDISYGKSPLLVAHERSITPGTLRNHLHRVNEKLGTHNRLEAIIEAKRRGIL